MIQFKEKKEWHFIKENNFRSFSTIIDGKYHHNWTRINLFYRVERKGNNSSKDPPPTKVIRAFNTW